MSIFEFLDGIFFLTALKNQGTNIGFYAALKMVRKYNK